jgi:hypothetical protein
MPFAVLEYLPYRIDSIGYEQILNLGFTQIFDGIKSSVISGRQEWILRGWFLLIDYPFVNHNALYSAGGFVPLNIFMISLSAIIAKYLAEDFAINHNLAERSRFISWFVFAAFMMSPMHLYYSNGLLKDQTSILLALLSVLLFIRKKFMLFVVVLMLAVAVRSYNFLIVFLYIIAIRKPGKLDYVWMVMFAIIMFIAVRFNPIALVNMVFATGYTYMNPLPYKGENWAFPISLITTQGLLFGIGFFYGLLQIFSAKLRRDGLNRIALCIALYGCIGIAVGYNNVVNLSRTVYEFGQGGDEMTRKTMPILPLVCIQMGYVVLRLTGRARTRDDGQSMIRPRKSDEAA